MQRLSKGTYLAALILCYVIAMGLNVVMIMITLGTQTTDGQPNADAAGQLMGVLCLSVLNIIALLVIQCILLYKMWAAIQDPQYPPRTTSGLAVGLQFVPFYNLYWIFQAYWGWAVDYNRLVDNRRLNVPRMPEGIGLGYCIIVLIAIVPACIPGIGSMISAGMSLISFILLMMFFSNGIDGVNALAEAESGSPSDDQDDPSRDEER